jgi:hypothetical protein
MVETSLLLNLATARYRDWTALFEAAVCGAGRIDFEHVRSLTSRLRVERAANRRNKPGSEAMDPAMFSKVIGWTDE